MTPGHWQILKLAASSAVGVLAIWGTLEPRKLAAHDFSPLIDPINMNHAAKEWLKCILFVILGTAVCQLAVRPKTAQESLVAGVGWLSIIVKPASQVSRKPAKPAKAGSHKD